MSIAFLVIFAAAVGYWGQTKGHSFWLGFIASLLLSPLIGAIIVACLKKKEFN